MLSDLAHLALGAALLLPSCACFERQHAPEGPGNRHPSALGSGGRGGTLRVGTSCTDLCRSNSTHVFWTDPHGGGEGSFQPFSDAVSDSVQYLRRNIMPFDVPNLETLGFPPDQDPSDEGESSSANGLLSPRYRRVQRREQAQKILHEEERQSLQLPAGLSDGIVNRTVHLALQTKVDHAWADSVPRHIFFEYILNYACSNEARTNWRPLFTGAVQRIIAAAGVDVDQARVEDIVALISKEIWSALSPDPTKPIHFVAGQTPLIFDPMSVVAYGYASCTGMSIALAFALRAAGVPARLVGTPAWNGNPDLGNHNWVEVWTSTASSGDGEATGQWRIMEGGDDSLEKDPCERWFCNSGRFDGKTRVYATRLDRSLSNGTAYPLAWDAKNLDVPGEDRTRWYTEICSKC